MAFWNKSPDSTAATPVNDPLDSAQYALLQARRRLLGALVLLALACALIPWMLDNSARPWAEDVILRMPKSEQPYQAKPTNPVPPAKPVSDVKPVDTTPTQVKP
jgi:cell division septation protein DedD